MQAIHVFERDIEKVELIDIFTKNNREFFRMKIWFKYKNRDIYGGFGIEVGRFFQGEIFIFSVDDVIDNDKKRIRVDKSTIEAINNRSYEILKADGRTFLKSLYMSN